MILKISLTTFVKKIQFPKLHLRNTLNIPIKEKTRLETSLCLNSKLSQYPIIKQTPLYHYLQHNQA